MCFLLLIFASNSVITGKEKDIAALENGGNKKVVAIFEGKINFDTPKPDGFSDSKTREMFIRAKYEQRLYYNENSMAKEDSKTKSGGGLTLKAPKADTASTFDAFGFGEEQSAGQRRNRRASMTMMVGSSSSHHKQPESSWGFNESFNDNADEFGGEGDDDEWWEPFDANGSGDDPFGTVQTHASDLNRSSSRMGEEGAGGGGSVTSRRRLVSKGDDMAEQSKPRSRRAARRGSVGMTSSNHSKGSNHSSSGDFSIASGSTSSRRLNYSNHSKGDDVSIASAQRSSRRLGGGKKKDPLSVSFHDEREDFAETRTPKRNASADDANALVGQGDKSSGRRRTGRRGSIGTSSSSIDAPGKKSSDRPRSMRVLGSSSRSIDKSAPRRSRSDHKKPHSLRNLPGSKGPKKLGDADETVTTVDSEESGNSYGIDSSSVKPKSGKLLGALYGGDPNAEGAPSPAMSSISRRKPRRRGSVC